MDDPVTPPSFGTAFQAQLLDLFRWRRDVRHFCATPVPPALVDELIAVACLAPSVGYSQPWRFVLVEGAARREAVRANFAVCNAAALGRQHSDRAAEYARLKLAGLEQAPCHLAVFADPDPAEGHGLGRQTMPQTPSYSAVMAVHTLWLAARAAGLGLGWVSILDPAVVTRVLDVPTGWVFIGYFCLGYPKADYDTPELERAGWERRQAAETIVVRR